MEIAILIIGLLSLLIGLAGCGYKAFTFIKARKVVSLSRNDLILLGVGLGLIGLGGSLITEASSLLSHWGWNNVHRVFGWILQFFFCVSFACLWLSFFLYYYKPDMEAKQRKIARILMFAAIPASLGFFLGAGEMVSPYLSYPLVSGFAIDGSGFHWFNYETKSNYGGFAVAFYGLVILLGALTCYWISDHRLYKIFHKHVIVDSVFLLAFPAGILGARIWYVVGNWHRDGFDQDFASIFRIWDGGLTILGGAALGIIVGVAFVLTRRKYLNIRLAIDLIVPTILLGQAIGRWGNFFNHEVYGAETSMWMFLPTWLRNQMATSFVDGVPGSTMYVPLFLIESLINIAGYFVIAWGVPALWKKKRSLGDLCGFYLLWYGIVRIFLEPLRDSTYNMGMDNSWSICNSLVYILLGAFLILGFQLYDLYKEKKDPRPLLFASMGLSFVGLIMLALPSLNIADELTKEILKRYTGYQVIFGGNASHLIAFISLVLGSLALIALSVLVLLKKADKKTQNILLGVSSLLLLLGSALILFGANAVAYEGSGITKNLSFGFFLAPLCSAGVLMLLWAYFFGSKEKKVDVKEIQEDEAKQEETKNDE